MEWLISTGAEVGIRFLPKYDSGRESKVVSMITPFPYGKRFRIIVAMDPLSAALTGLLLTAYPVFWSIIEKSIPW